jgi:hypothetical protein
MDSERTVMQKETIVKDDGRRLIYYRFVPEGNDTPAAEPKEP